MKHVSSRKKKGHSIKNKYLDVYCCSSCAVMIIVMTTKCPCYAVPLFPLTAPFLKRSEAARGYNCLLNMELCRLTGEIGPAPLELGGIVDQLPCGDPNILQRL